MKNRASNIELLRIVSMMMIVVWHFLVHAIDHPNMIGFEFQFWNAGKALTVSATSIFVLISGYWGIRFSFRKVLSLYLQCFIWGLIGYVLYVLCANTPPMEMNKLFGRVLAFTHNKWWFINTYLELMFLAPLLNAAIDYFNKKQHLYFIMLFALVTIYMGYCRETGEDVWGTSLSHFLWLYMIARYINKYVSLDTIQSKRWWWFSGFLAASTITFGLSILEANYAVPCSLRPYPYCSPWTVIAAVCALLFALSFTFESKVVNWFASSSLSCYLFQDGIYFGTLVFYPVVGAWLLSLPMGERYAILIPLAIAFMIPVILVDKLWTMVLYRPVLTIYDKLYERYIPESFKSVF